MRLTFALLAAVVLPPALSAQDPMAARTKGRPTAPVTVYEMSDFQCPYCRRFALEIFPTLEQEYVRSGKVRWVFINFPLVQTHPNAEPAAEVAMCGARQGKFWPVHDLLFRNQATWATLKAPAEYFMTLADSAALDRSAFQQCLQSGATRAEVENDAGGAVRAGANSTPTFYIEGGIMAGAQPLEVFRPILDSIYAVKTAKAR
jgi:protein-disulfide isomerase